MSIRDFNQQVHQDYLESQILAARPAERVLMLYGIAIDSIKAAIGHLKDGDVFARGKSINKAHLAIDELNFALDHSLGASFTRRLSDLYLYTQRQLVAGHSQKSEQALQEALTVLVALGDTWKIVVERTCGTGDPGTESKTAGSEEAKEAITTGQNEEFASPMAAYADSFQTSVSSRDWTV